jgi:hypothetical protein
MFMHMPTKWGIVVMLAVAAALGGWYAFMVRSGQVSGWTMVQGSGRLARDATSGVRYLDVAYTVKQPAKALFTFANLHGAGCDNGPGAITFSYQSEWPAVMLVAVTERSGSTWQARVELKPSEQWMDVRLPATQFAPRPPVKERDANREIDLARLAPTVEFYDGAGVALPSTTFSNRVKLTAPRCELPRTPPRK